MNDYRLPPQIVPAHYDLTLRPDIDDASFVGDVTIDINVLETTDAIVLNAAELTIDAVELDGVTIDGSAIALDDDDERVAINAPGIDLGTHQLTIRFTGKLNDKLRGFYRSSWVDEEGNTKYLATTQFEATDARRAFPCWDEPERKATFAIALEVPEDMMAVSCQSETSSESLGDGYKRVTFAPTPLLSTYLIAFVVGDLEATEPVDANGTPMRIVHVPGKGPLTKFALDAGAFALSWLSNYFGSDYPGDKIDMIAIPDFAMGAMENFGCVTYREVLLVVDPDSTTQAERERSVDVIAHELAHMWFGDLVTMKWWNGLWLKEAFATFTELKVTDAYRPQWHRWDSFAQSRSQAFSVDALEATRPIEFEVRSPSDAEAMYDVLTYEKGAAVVRMLEQFLGEDTFQAGVQQYLAEHAYANTETDDLWRALEQASNQPVENIMTRWIFQGGFALVDCAVNGATVTLRQTRFAHSPDAATGWELLDVPVILRYGADGATYEHRVLLRGEHAEIELDRTPEWVLANANTTGFYRCRYEDDGRAQLLAHVGELSPAERFGLVDDLWNLLLAGKTTLGAVITAIETVAALADFLSAGRCLSVASSLSLLARSDSDADAVASLARRLGQTVLDRTDPAASDELVIGLRAHARQVLGTVGNDQATIDWAKAGDFASAADEKAALLIRAAHGDQAELDAFVQAFKTAPTPQIQQRYLQAFSWFGGAPEQMAQILAMTLDGTIRTQDAPLMLGNALANKNHGVQVWQFIATNWDTLTKAFPSSAVARMVSGLGSLSQADVSPEPNHFFAENPAPQAAKRIAQLLEQRWATVRLADELDDVMAATIQAGSTAE